MDFPLAGMMRRVFAQRSAPLAELMTYLEQRGPDMPPGMARATLLDNHDMHRFLWLADGKKDRLKLAALCQMTLEGVPIIYYGTEVGLSQDGDAHLENAYARAPMIWDGRQDRALLLFYQQLIALRQAHPALRRGSHTPMAAEVEGGSAEAQAQVGAYLRSSGDDHVLVVLNNNEQPVTLRVVLTGQSVFSNTETGHLVSVRHLLTPASTPAIHVTAGAIELELPPLGGAVLEQS